MSVQHPEAGVLVRNLSQLTPLSYAKRAISYFILLCRISCELAAVYTGLFFHDSRLRPNQTLVSYMPNFFTTPASVLRGSTQRWNNTTSWVSGMVWLYCSPIHRGEMQLFLPHLWILPVNAQDSSRGEGARSLYIFLIEKNIAAEILNAGTLVQSCGSMVY
jgi:hypothetical protein